MILEKRIKEVDDSIRFVDGEEPGIYRGEREQLASENMGSLAQYAKWALEILEICGPEEACRECKILMVGLGTGVMLRLLGSRVSTVIEKEQCIVQWFLDVHPSYTEQLIRVGDFSRMEPDRKYDIIIEDTGYMFDVSAWLKEGGKVFPAR